LTKQLIAKGGDVNAKTNKTPAGGGASVAAACSAVPRANRLRSCRGKGRQAAVMKALVEAGADPKVHAQDGSTLLMAAANSGHLDVVSYAYELDSPAVKAVTRYQGGCDARGSHRFHAGVHAT